jgi:ferritin-like protein
VPGTVKGLAQTAAKAVAGESVAVLVDKLGERLAFERTGARLYEALLAKLELGRNEPGAPPREEVLEIYSEERRHFELVHRSMEQLGADPTAQTPGADLAGVSSMGVLQIVCDPRTRFPECLQAVLQAEAVDREGWTLLVSLARGFGQDAMAAEFEIALANEEKHLQRVRRWLSELVQRAAFGEVHAPEPVGAA